jgi:hypothetical protein
MIRKLVLALALGVALPASAGVTVSVDGKTEPWVFNTDGGVNSSFQFGDQDGLPPVSVSFAAAGITDTWAVVYKGGLTSAFGPPADADQNGHVGSVFKDNDPGSSNNFFPSHYMPGLWSDDPGAGVFLNALVFVFTDDAGQIVGTPDAMNVTGNADSGYTFIFEKSGDTPDGATHIQLGLNDDIFGDNAGALSVCVGASVDACATAPGVPEPASWALMLGGFGLAGAALRRRRQALAT